MRLQEIAKKAAMYACVGALVVSPLSQAGYVANMSSVEVSANDDIILNGDETGASSLIGTYNIAGGYSYLGFATLKDVTADYKYLIITYAGDISSVRFQAARVTATEDETGGFFWFDSTNPEGHFVTADGSPIPLDGGNGTTVVIDLEASGFDVSTYNSIHIHAGNGTNSTLVIGNARLSKTADINASDVIPETTAPEETTVTETPTDSQPVELGNIVLDSSRSDSPLIKEWKPAVESGYAYLGYAYVGAPAGYKYLELSYTGDATAFNDLRWEFVGQHLAGFSNPYDGLLKTVDGTALPAPSAEEQTVIIDLEASGFDLTKGIDAIHLHQTADNGSFTITNATLMASLPATEDIILNGDEAGASSMIGTYKAPTERGVPVDKYKYLGFATLKNPTADYKYMILTYSGNITGLRFEFATVVDGVETAKTEPYWFNKDGQTLFFETADGSDVKLDGGEGTTVVIDLANTGIDLGKYNSVHMHCEGMATNGNFKIGQARLAVTPDINAVIDVMPAEETTTPEVTTTQTQTTQKETTQTQTTTKKVVAPKQAKVKKATKKKKATTAKIYLTKIKGAVGYEVKVSTSKKFTKKTTKTVTTKKLTVTVKKLKKNAQYYTKARAYVLKNKKVKVYGKWSKVVKVKNTK